MISIVDKDDNVIGAKDRDALEVGDIYRVSALWITDENGHVLLAQRARSKKHDPGLWGPSVAGTVESNESYEENIIKEAWEELGLRIAARDLKVGPKTFIKGRRIDYFDQWFFLTIPHDTPLTLDPAEVAATKWISRDQLMIDTDQNPKDFLRTTPQWLPHLLQ